MSQPQPPSYPGRPDQQSPPEYPAPPQYPSAPQYPPYPRGQAPEQPQAQYPGAPQTPNPHQGGADIPAQDPVHQNPSARPRRTGALGWLGTAGLAGFGLWKYALLFLKFKFVLTGVTLLISYAAYAWALGPIAALGIVLMIFIHEMGHVIEINRQGMTATAPVFIPFMGAAIFQRQMAPDALRQAQIGIAGPIAGTIGATAAFVLYGTTHNPSFLVWAWFGFLINLFNLIPAGMLDGGWILAPVSKWFQVLGLGLIALLFIGPLFLGSGPIVSPIILLVVLLGLPATIARFRNAGSPYFTSVPPMARLAMGAAWLGLVCYLTVAMIQTQSLLAPFIG